MPDKLILNIADAAAYLGVDSGAVLDLIACGDLSAVGSNKDMVLVSCLNRFAGGLAVPPTLPIPVAPASGSDVLFRDYLMDYLAGMQNSVSSSTFNGRYTNAKYIIKSLGEYRMRDLNRDLIIRFVNGLTVLTYVRGVKGEPRLLGQNIINKVFDILKGALDEALERGLVTADLMGRIKKPKSKKLVESCKRDLDDDSVRILKSIVSHDLMLQVLVYILLYTGMRPSECKALKFSDFDYAHKTVSVQRTLKTEIPLDVVSGRRGVPYAIIGNIKNHSTQRRVNYSFRTLVVSDVVLNVVKQWKSFILSSPNIFSGRIRHHTEDFIFCGADGRIVTPDYYDQKLSRLFSQFGYTYGDFSLYRLRHTYCTRLCRKGVNPKIIARMMGDNTVSMVMEVYNDINKNDVLTASADFAKDMDFTLFHSIS